MSHVNAGTARGRGPSRLHAGLLGRLAAGAAVAALVAVGSAAPAAGVDDFSDVETASAHHDDIADLAADGVFAGTECGDGLFCPGTAVKRSEAAVWMVRVLDDGNPDAVSSTRFSDVDATQWWARHVERLAALEVTNGCATRPTLRFCPDDPVTRAQMASLLARAFELESADSAGFTDVDDANVHLAHIDALHAAGVTQGCLTDPLRFCPAENVTRAQMASFLNRARNLDDGDAAGASGSSGSSGSTRTFTGGSSGGSTTTGQAGGGAQQDPPQQDVQQQDPPQQDVQQEDPPVDVQQEDPPQQDVQQEDPPVDVQQQDPAPACDPYGDTFADCETFAQAALREFNRLHTDRTFAWISDTPGSWTDGSMGCHFDDHSYPTGEVHGFSVTAGDDVYVHSNIDGSLQYLIDDTGDRPMKVARLRAVRTLSGSTYTYTYTYTDIPDQECSRFQDRLWRPN